MTESGVQAAPTAAFPGKRFDVVVTTPVEPRGALRRLIGVRADRRAGPG